MIHRILMRLRTLGLGLPSGTPGPSDRPAWLRSWPVLALVGMVLVFFGTRLLSFDGRFIAGQDTLDYHLWSLLFLRKQVSAGTLPLWNPHVYCGQPFLANPVNFALYPPVVLFLVLPMPWAFGVDLVLHVALAGAGGYALTRALSGSRSAGLVAGLAYALGSNMILRIHAGHLVPIHAAAWLPWVFYYLERAFSPRRYRALVLAGVAFALELLSGYLQGCVYTAIFACIYLIVRSLLGPHTPGSNAGYRRAAAWLVVPATALGLGAVALLPAQELLARSNRAVASYAFATRLSMPPENFATLLLPQVETSALTLEADYGCYIGILPLLLAILGILWASDRRRILTWVLLVLIAVSFALGGYTPIYHLYTGAIPIVGKMRVPARALFVLVLFLAVLAGLGAETLRSELSGKRLRRCLLIMAPLLLAGLIGGALGLDIPLAGNAMLTTYAMLGLALALLALWPSLVRSRLAGVLLVGTVFVDLALRGSPGLPVARFDDVMAKLDYERLLAMDPGDYRVLIPIGLSPANMSLASRCSAFGCYNAGGYVPGGLEELYVFLHAMADLPVPTWTQHTPDLTLFRPSTVFSSRILGIKYAIVFTPGGKQLMGTDRYMPRASLLPRAVVVPRQDEQLRILKDPRFDPAETVLLERDPDGHIDSLPAPGEAKTTGDRVAMLRYGANGLELGTGSSRSSFLLLSELFYPGWRAWVDGQEAPILRADYLLRAIPLTAGEHRVRLELAPDTLRLGGAITLATLLTLLLLWLRSRQPRAAASGSRCAKAPKPVPTVL